MSPVRIQRRRIKGWRSPPNTVNVTRPGPFANWTRVGPDEGDARTAADAVVAFRFRCDTSPGFREAIRTKLRGKNLMCFCRLCEAHKDGKPFDVECADCAPCHADPLGIIANAPASAGGRP